MSNVIDFDKKLTEKYGEARFITCDCDGHSEAGWAVICLPKNEGEMFITSLLCLGCEKEISIAYGVIELG